MKADGVIDLLDSGSYLYVHRIGKDQIEIRFKLKRENSSNNVNLDSTFKGTMILE